jgi:hypothetical protein
VYVAMCSDDLWLAVICQTNLEIAGSPRKVFRDLTVMLKLRVVELLDGASRGNLSCSNQTPNNRNRSVTRQPHGAKLMRLEGNNPDSRLRSLNHN